MQAVLIRGLPATALEARHVDLLDPPLELLCQLCYSLVPELLELSCGHVMCRWCCQSEAEVPRFFECPIDNNELVLDEKGTRFRSRLVRKDLATLMGCQAACLNRAHGCPMQGTLQEMVDHLDKCDFDRIECRRCHRFLPRIDLATHVSGHCHGARFLPSMVCLESADLWRLGLSLQDTVAETTEKQLALYMRPIQQMLEQLLKNDGGAHSNGGFHTNQQSPPPGRTLKAALGRFTERTVGNPTGSLSSCAHPIAPVDANMLHVSCGTETPPNQRRTEFPVSVKIASQPQHKLDLLNLQSTELQAQLSNIQGILSSLALAFRETQNAIASLHEKRSFWNIIRFSQIKMNLERCRKDHLGVSIPNDVFRLSHSGRLAVLYVQFERQEDGKFWLAMHIAFRADSQVTTNLEWPFKGKIALMIVHPEDRLLSRRHVLDAMQSCHQKHYLRPVSNRGREGPRGIGGRLLSLEQLETEGFVAADDSITLAVVASEQIKTSFLYTSSCPRSQNQSETLNDTANLEGGQNC